jgi:hypothetical protein
MACQRSRAGLYQAPEWRTSHSTCGSRNLAAVSTWLNSGEGPRVAKWAGHSLAVLLRVYAKCLDGGEQAARDRVERTLTGQ